MLKLINEARVSRLPEDKVNEILNAADEVGFTLLRDLYNTSWKDQTKTVTDAGKNAFNNIVNVYAKDMGISANNLDIEDFIDWLTITEDNHLGGLVFDYFDDLSLATIMSIYTIDDKFKHAIDKYLVKVGLMTEDGKDAISFRSSLLDQKLVYMRKIDNLKSQISDYENILSNTEINDDIKIDNIQKEIDKLTKELNDAQDKMNSITAKGKNADMYEMIRTIFEWWAHEGDYSDVENNPDAVTYHRENIDSVLKDVEDIYNKLNESICEEVEDEITTKSTEEEQVGEVPTNEEEISEVEKIEENSVEEEIQISATVDSIKNLENEVWKLISSVKSIIMNLDLLQNKEAIKEVLETINDDLTIDIGMINKVSNMLSENEAELISVGEEKAEAITEE